MPCLFSPKTINSRRGSIINQTERPECKFAGVLDGGRGLLNGGNMLINRMNRPFKDILKILLSGLKFSFYPFKVTKSLKLLLSISVCLRFHLQFDVVLVERLEDIIEITLHHPVQLVKR